MAELMPLVNAKCLEGYIASTIITPNLYRANYLSSGEREKNYIQIMTLNVPEEQLGHVCNIECLINVREHYDRCTKQYDQLTLAMESVPKEGKPFVEIQLEKMKDDLESQEKYMSELQARLEKNM
jgi:16S rRNA G527 N7-methylase RsmG